MPYGIRLQIAADLEEGAKAFIETANALRGAPEAGKISFEKIKRLVRHAMARHGHDLIPLFEKEIIPYAKDRQPKKKDTAAYVGPATLKNVLPFEP
jgi:hypothetical protein